MKIEINQRGTTAWQANCFRTGQFPKFLDDLQAAQTNGLPPVHQELVKRALANLTNAATAIPDGSLFQRAIWKDCQKLEAGFSQWCTVTGNSVEAQKHRARCLQILRKQRHNLAKRFRKNTHVLNTKLDLAFVTACHESMISLATAAPTLFKGLAKALAEFSKKLKGS